tara:strand:+ start:146 stop:640 length:495 start_codon:yes stop_codon:yes gene_type:complete
MDNFQDRYIRTNPRRNAKMSPILWDDNTSRYLTYHGKGSDVECFTNMEGYVQKYTNVNGQENRKTTQVKCKNGLAEVMVNDNGNVTSKMYDIDLDSIASNKVKGTMKEIDNIHNDNVSHSMSYDRMMLNHLRNTMGRLNKQINPSVMSLHNRTLDNDPFFFPNK